MVILLFTYNPLEINVGYTPTKLGKIKDILPFGKYIVG